MHPTMIDFLKRIESGGRSETGRSYEQGIRQFDGWLEKNGVDPLAAGAADLERYQAWLSEEYRTAKGEPLARYTQRTRLCHMCSYYSFLERRGLILSNPTTEMRLPRVKHRTTPKDYLDLQEATALIQTQAKRILSEREGSFRWAAEHRNLAMLCLALATGRRVQSLLGLTVSALDLERCELRIDLEKGLTGRVLPVAKWAIDVCRIYLEKARARFLNGAEDIGLLFPGLRNKANASVQTTALVLRRIHLQAIEDNPDLEDLAHKHISPHCLRVSFATLLFKGGCNIRSINELMLHRKLSTTATYTPIPLEDLRRVCRATHPRA